MNQDYISAVLTDLEADDSLAHYGVKGMKWRHRKAKKKQKIRSRLVMRKRAKRTGYKKVSKYFNQKARRTESGLSKEMRRKAREQEKQSHQEYLWREAERRASEKIRRGY